MALRSWLAGAALPAAMLPIAGWADPNLTIAPGAIERHVVPRDAIPALFLPKHVSAGEVRFLRDKERIIALELGGVSVAYPTRILEHHQIVNDRVSGTPLTVTYWPLCGSAAAFDPQLEGRRLDFGVSGDLYNPNLLMYDHQTGSEWLQLTGTAIEGPFGRKLRLYPVAYDEWASWRRNHPDGFVLTIPEDFAGRFGSYDDSPYAGYDDTPQLWFHVSALDRRLPRKARVVGVEARGDTKATLRQPSGRAASSMIESAELASHFSLTANVHIWRLCNRTPISVRRFDASRRIGA